MLVSFLVKSSVVVLVFYMVPSVRDWRKYVRLYHTSDLSCFRLRPTISFRKLEKKGKWSMTEHRS